MDIIIIRNNFQTLVDVVIVDLTRTDLVQHAITTTHASRVVAQDKVRSYTERTPRDDFIPLAIETHGCLHPHFDSFFTSYVHANIACHQQTSLVPLTFISY
jgi:hypothetical protein